MRVLALVAAAAFAAAACGPTSGAVSDQRQTDRQLKQYQTVQPVPYFDYSEQRNTLIQIYEAKNDARNTWAVVQSLTGANLWSCPSKGFPIPADTQLTSPDQYYSGTTIDQMEPDGLYSSGNTDATYVLCIRPNGKVVPVYTEQKVTMFPWPVEVRNGELVDLDTGNEQTIEVEIIGGNSEPAASPTP